MIITEIPHITNPLTKTTIDLQIEKYPMPAEEKKALIMQYKSKGVVAYSNKIKKYILFSYNGTVHLIKPERIKQRGYVVLPNYWEKYIVGKFKPKEVEKQDAINDKSDIDEITIKKILKPIIDDELRKIIWHE